MPELHLKQSVFTYRAYGAFTKHGETIPKISKTIKLKHLYRNELDKACFAHDAAYSDSKDVAKRTTLEKILKEKANEIARNGKSDGYQRGLASMAYKIFDEKQDWD